MCGNTGHHVIAANNFLVHLMLWHVTWQCWYSTVKTILCYSHAYCVKSTQTRVTRMCSCWTACVDAGHHIIIAANSCLVHLILWHVTWQC